MKKIEIPIYLICKAVAEERLTWEGTSPYFTPAFNFLKKWTGIQDFKKCTNALFEAEKSGYIKTGRCGWYLTEKGKLLIEDKKLNSLKRTHDFLRELYGMTSAEMNQMSMIEFRDKVFNCLRHYPTNSELNRRWGKDNNEG